VTWPIGKEETIMRKFKVFQLGYLIGRMFIEGGLLALPGKEPEEERAKNETNMIYMRIQEICISLNFKGVAIYWQNIDKLLTSSERQNTKILAKTISDIFKLASISLEECLTGEEKALFLLGQEIARENSLLMACSMQNWEYKSKFSIPKDLKKYDDEIYSLALELEQAFANKECKRITILIERIHKALLMADLRQLKDESDTEQTFLEKATKVLQLQFGPIGIDLNELNKLIKHLFRKK